LIVLLAASTILLTGCAGENKTTDDTTTSVLQPVPSQDDSHGWGANLQNASQR